MCLQYTAIDQSAGAPLRAVTVRDAIGDLPAISNGAAADEAAYAQARVCLHQATAQAMQGAGLAHKSPVPQAKQVLPLRAALLVRRATPFAAWHTGAWCQHACV